MRTNWPLCYLIYQSPLQRHQFNQNPVLQHRFRRVKSVFLRHLWVTKLYNYAQFKTELYVQWYLINSLNRVQDKDSLHTSYCYLSRHDGDGSLVSLLLPIQTIYIIDGLAERKQTPGGSFSVVHTLRDGRPLIMIVSGRLLAGRLSMYMISSEVAIAVK